MIRLAAMLLALTVAPALSAQEVENAPAGTLRVLDKVNGEVTDIEIAAGAQARVGLLDIRLEECRYPTDNPSGNAFALLSIFYNNQADATFRGWMIAASPALNAMDHPRYDVWVLRCATT